ncbi:hypothetical protein [Rhodocyclus tenuis]|uniref:Uncharacterized protein n=1 Tax=Rhodocyclus tenuis TaxID=1066 RepID=A0A840GIT3_RHOTE|nr:hypothetical protein [Rhodocyclus tenuis]MBB4248372.1 hypothetical protein [Rhodocyclus tenuis]
MATPVAQIHIGALVERIIATQIASGAYAAQADCLTVDNSDGLALLADFELTHPTTGAAPVAGSIQIVAVDWSLDGATQPPAPFAGLLGTPVGALAPSFGSTNTVKPPVFSRPRVPLRKGKTDYYLFNAGTGQPILAGAVFRARKWSPGAP